MKLPVKSILFFATLVASHYLVAQPVRLPSVQQTNFKTDSFNIVKFGAKSDGSSSIRKVSMLLLMPVMKRAGE
jgi:hypothetical protein